MEKRVPKRCTQPHTVNLSGLVARSGAAAEGQQTPGAAVETQHSCVGLLALADRGL